MGERAGMSWQLILQNIVVSLFQLDSRKAALDVGIHGAGIRRRCRQAEDNCITIAKSVGKTWASNINEKSSIIKQHEHLLLTDITHTYDEH